jgi:2-keto-4-pentenoate hydratase/2-oxohepta-3-ene-1,7-dioic acid hydratase in catechol pathway
MGPDVIICYSVNYDTHRKILKKEEEESPTPVMFMGYF